MPEQQLHNSNITVSTISTISTIAIPITQQASVM
jgi:hypothetical protein